MNAQVITGGELVERDPLEDDRDQQEELFTLYDEMSEGDRNETTINVVRVPVDVNGNQIPGAKVGGHLFQALLGTMSKSEIIVKARKFIRAGQTSIMIRVTGSRKGKRGPLFHKIFTVERENIEEKTGGENNTSELFKLIQENQRIADERNQQFMQQMLGMQSQALTTRASVPVTDPMDTMVKMMAAMGGMMGVLMNGGQRAQVAPPDPMDQMLKMVTVARQMGSVLRGEEPAKEDEGLGSIIKAVAGPALSFFAAQKQNENIKLAQGGARPVRRLAAPVKSAPIQPPPADTRDPNTIIPPVDPTAQNSNKKDVPVELQKLNAALNTVLDLADKGRAPAEVAKLVLDSIPEGEESDFYDQIVNDDFISHCELLNERVTAHKPWFEELRAAMLSEFVPDEGIEAAATPAAASPAKA